MVTPYQFWLGAPEAIENSRQSYSGVHQSRDYGKTNEEQWLIVPWASVYSVSVHCCDRPRLNLTLCYFGHHECFPLIFTLLKLCIQIIVFWTIQFIGAPLDFAPVASALLLIIVLIQGFIDEGISTHQRGLKCQLSHLSPDGLSSALVTRKPQISGLQSIRDFPAYLSTV